MNEGVFDDLEVLLDNLLNSPEISLILDESVALPVVEVMLEDLSDGLRLVKLPTGKDTGFLSECPDNDFLVELFTEQRDVFISEWGDALA